VHRFGSPQLPLAGSDHFLLVAIASCVAALGAVGLAAAGMCAGDGAA
jgi:hypothetical protein